MKSRESGRSGGGKSIFVCNTLATLVCKVCLCHFVFAGIFHPSTRSRHDPTGTTYRDFMHHGPQSTKVQTGKRGYRHTHAQSGGGGFVISKNKRLPLLHSSAAISSEQTRSFLESWRQRLAKNFKYRASATLHNFQNGIEPWLCRDI